MTVRAFLRSSLTLAVGIALATVCVASRSRASEPPRVLTICAEPASMPRTGKAPDGTPTGVDVAVAQLVARSLGRPVEFHWCASAACSWNCLPEKRCDVVVGQPRDSAPSREVAWSVPYASGQFGLVVARGTHGVRSLADLRGKRVGIVTGTVPLSEKDHTVIGFKRREELLERFGAAGLDAAYLDADFAAWYLHEHPGLALATVDGPAPRERWNMALATRAADAQLIVELNRALAQLAESGALRKVYADHGLHFRSPHNGVARQELLPDTWRKIRNRGELVVSMDPANLPYSSAKDDQPGIDVELARALATKLDVKPRIEWLDVQRETAIGELLERQCDLVMGAAIDPSAVDDEDELAEKVVYSRPYYGTGYILVRRKGGPAVRTLADFKGEKSQRLGTEAGSLADYSLRQRGYLRRLYRNQLSTLKALDDGDIDAAYVWANVGWTLHTSPDFRVELVPDYTPEDHWNIAVAVCRGDDELKQHVDTALSALVADGTVARVLARYHVPGYAPFPEQGRAGRDEPLRYPVASRGPEPQMQKVQASKSPYAGLARIRSAGEIVVGLDQNNLPFSSAHPVPAGLDYEIARLLAEQLGVALRVYWAYSSHDSYPSKLASRQLCDMVLGVMPDDRFGRRVLYSRPYYLATYDWVVRSGDGPPSDGDLVAAEQGVAVRGLGGRKVRSLASTEEVLGAVADGRVRAGYVISTRGPWLAQKQRPGLLKFVPVAGSPDQFPIGAAFRKGDADLKEAVDRALQELERSGRLAAVFARWQIDYRTVQARETRKLP